MLGIPADTALAWANVISLGGLVVAVAGSVVAYQLSAGLSTAHSLELQQVKSAAQHQIATVETQAHMRSAELVEMNEGLQLEVQSARTALSTRPTGGEVTDEQVARFADGIKGKVQEINLFTAPGREASILGITILDGLRDAGVAVNWYRMRSAPTFRRGTADSGVTIYEYPAGQGHDGVARVLANAFTAMNVEPNLVVTDQPLYDFPSPSIFVAAPRPPEFLRSAQGPIRSATISDLFSQTE